VAATSDVLYYDVMNDRAVQKDAGWRRAMPDIKQRAEAVVTALEGLSLHDAADVVRRLVHLLDSRVANEAAEERAAWDRYASAGSESVYDAAERADAMLLERRDRFGPEPGTVAERNEILNAARVAQKHQLHDVAGQLKHFADSKRPRR
jgi:hypothetical protein